MRGNVHFRLWGSRWKYFSGVGSVGLEWRSVLRGLDLGFWDGFTVEGLGLTVWHILFGIQGAGT